MSDDWPRRARREQSKAHPIGRETVDAIKDQLLIVFLKRLGSEVVIPLAEVDDTGDDNFSLSVDPVTKDFTFKVTRKGHGF